MAVMGDEALTGRLLDDRYRVGELIARGGMASVFLGTDERLDRTVAIKVMHRGLGDPAAFTERFKREAKAAAKLNHRNVVAVFDQGHDGDTIYLVMEYVPGRTLRDVMREAAPMKPARALGLIEPVVVALAAAHDAHLIHRDIKPENVLITPEGDVKVADFGLARAVTAASTATSNTLIGTVSYLAPEIVSHQGVDARSDVYAVGAMLYEMLTGVKPHSGDSPIQVAYKHVHEDIGPPSAFQRGIPPYVDALVARATVRDRRCRAADAKVLLRYVRLTQDALAAGLTDDVELTLHLLPPTTPGSDEPTVSVPSASPTTRQSASAADPDEPTRQWRFDSMGSTAPAPQPTTAAADRPNAPTRHDRRRRRGARGQVMLIGALVMAFVAAGLGYWLGVGRYVDAPMLVGLTEANAEAAADKAGFDFKIAERRFSEKQAAGVVLDTDPKPGGRILPGHAIQAVVSKGPERYQVPDLTGETVADAKNLLKDLGLKMGTLTEEYDSEVKEGRVVKPVGLTVGQQVPKGSVIDLIVSKGGEPINAPDVVGKIRDDAITLLEAEELKVEIVYATDERIPKGYVAAQNAPAGQAIHRGDTIELTISKGRENIRVPRLVGRTRSQAEQLLLSIGLKIQFFDGDGSDWIVFDQTQKPGTVVANGTVIGVSSEPFRWSH